MKKIVILMAIMLGILVIIANQSYAATGTTNVSTARLREEPNSDSKTLELISIYQEVEIIDVEGDWYKVKYNDIEGYIFGELLNVSGEVENSSNTGDENTENEQLESEVTSEQPSEENTNLENENMSSLGNLPYNMKTKSETSVKITPLINSSNIGKIQAEKEVTITEIINDWCYITTENISGWTRIANLAEVVNEPQPEPEPSQDGEVSSDIDVETKIGYVNATTLYVRQEPTTESKIIYTAARNEEVEITQDLDGWYAVNVAEVQGYVASRYISDTKVDITSRGSNESREPIAVEEEPKQEQVTESENTEQEKITEPETTEQETVTEPETTEQETVTEPETTEQEPVVEPEITVQETEEREEESNDLGVQIVEYAKQYLGYKYVSGGTTTKGFDCSGFTQYVYAHFGISITRTSKTQAKDGEYIDKEDLQLGDLIIFNNTSNTSIGHVGIYIGDNSFIHAANEKKGVVITSLSDSYYKARYVSSRRVF